MLLLLHFSYLDPLSPSLLLYSTYNLPNGCWLLLPTISLLLSSLLPLAHSTQICQRDAAPYFPSWFSGKSHSQVGLDGYIDRLDPGALHGASKFNQRLHKVSRWSFSVSRADTSIPGDRSSLPLLPTQIVTFRSIPPESYRGTTLESYRGPKTSPACQRC